MSIFATGALGSTYLLVGKDEEHSLPELVLGEHSHQLVPGFTNSLTIVRIDYENETLGVLEVMAPQRPEKERVKLSDLNNH